jgi:mono/diheme cytochrome c family protein
MKISAKAITTGLVGLTAYATMTSAVLAPSVGDSSTPVGGPLPGLSPSESAMFYRGRAVFDRDFHRSTGLGAPGMNADSCRACHQDPILGGAGALELNVSRFGYDGDGTEPFMDLPGGQTLSKLFGPFEPFREECNPLATVFEQRQTPPIFGLGLVSNLPDAAIIANEDPTDANDDGILGVARRIDVNGIIEIGKFGWKAQLPRVTDFGRDAMLGECGITTPNDGRGLVPDVDQDTVMDPELTLGDFNDLSSFLTLLAPPERKGSTSAAVVAGELLFEQVGCASCHVPALVGPQGPVNLYSNLLLHNVMPVGFRGMAEPGAPVGMYRTAPLWGIAETAPYMHDGRAEDLDGAIRAHFSEGDNARVSYEGLSPEERAELIEFLRDL